MTRPSWIGVPVTVPAAKRSTADSWAGLHASRFACRPRLRLGGGHPRDKHVGAFHPNDYHCRQIASRNHRLGLVNNVPSGIEHQVWNVRHNLRTDHSGERLRRLQRCLLCGGESLDLESLQRLYCVHCSWFHEPLDADRLNLFAHLQTAMGEVQAALEIAELLNDAERVTQLKIALHELRCSLSRA